MPDPVLPPEMWGLWCPQRRTWIGFYGDYAWFPSKAEAETTNVHYLQKLIPVRLFPRDDNK